MKLWFKDRLRHEKGVWQLESKGVWQLETKSDNKQYKH